MAPRESLHKITQEVNWPGLKVHSQDGVCHETKIIEAKFTVKLMADCDLNEGVSITFPLLRKEVATCLFIAFLYHPTSRF